MDKWILFIATERKIFTYLLKRHTMVYENPVTSDGTNRFTLEIRKNTLNAVCAVWKTTVEYKNTSLIRSFLDLKCLWIENDDFADFKQEN